VTTSRERVQQAAGVSGRETVTPAPTQTDSDGILLPLTIFQIERLTRQQIDEYNTKRHEQIQTKKTEDTEAAAYRHYEEEFTKAGGRQKDAKAAYEAQKKADARTAAERESEEVMETSRRNIRSRL
jgi:hypothetical protein